MVAVVAIHLRALPSDLLTAIVIGPVEVLKLLLQLIALVRQLISHSANVLELALVCMVLPVEHVDLLLELADALVSLILLLLHGLAQLDLLGEVVVQLGHHVSLAVALRLKKPQLLDGLSAGHISLRDARFDAHILVTLPIQIHLEFIIDLVSAILISKLALHRFDVLIDHAHLLHQVAPVAVDTVQLSQHEVEAFRQGVVVCLQLQDVLI